MKRLLRLSKKKEVSLKDEVRLVENPGEFFIVIEVYNEKELCDLENSFGEIKREVSFEEIIGEDEFLIGDKVFYFKHPYDNKKVFTVEEVLSDGSYFIQNKDTSYTSVNGKNLKLKKDSSY